MPITLRAGRGPSHLTNFMAASVIKPGDIVTAPDPAGGGYDMEVLSVLCGFVTCRWYEIMTRSRVFTTAKHGPGGGILKLGVFHTSDLVMVIQAKVNR